MRMRNGFTPLENKIPDRESRGLPERHGEGLRLAGSQTDIRQRYRSFLTGFTLVELLTVIAIMVFLMAILLPSLQRAGKQTKSMVCQSNLRQWGLRFATLSEDGDNTFRVKNGLTPVPADWLEIGPDWEANYGDLKDLLLCPMAVNTKRHIKLIPGGFWYVGGAFAAWVCTEEDFDPILGSYGTNWSLWYFWNFNSEKSQYFYGPDSTNWSVRFPSRWPQLFDCALPASGFEHSYDPPPDTERILPPYSAVDFTCINRHDGYVNYLFMDSSVRKVGLKELWTLTWYSDFDTSGPWTRAGGAQPSDWPQWLRKYKDY